MLDARYFFPVCFGVQMCLSCAKWTEKSLKLWAIGHAFLGKLLIPSCLMLAVQTDSARHVHFCPLVCYRH